MKVKTVLLITLFFSSVVPFAHSDARFLNFSADYKFYFTGCVVGKGTLDARLDNKTYLISFKGKTTSLIRLLFKLDVTIKDAVDINTLRDVFYSSNSVRPKRRKNIYVLFDNLTTAKVIYEKNTDKKTYILKSKNGLYSPLSVYLFFLTHKYDLGRTYYRYIVISKNLYKVSITPEGYETINLDSLGRKKGEIRSLKVGVKFWKLNRNGELVKKSPVKELDLWVSKKAPQIPLLAKMWHIIGVFEAKLVKLKIN